MFSIQQRTIRGSPDLMGCINGYFLALELKSHEKAAVSPLQEYNIDSIIRAGGYALIVHPQNWEATKVMLKFYSTQEKKR